LSCLRGAQQQTHHTPQITAVGETDGWMDAQLLQVLQVQAYYQLRPLAQKSIITK